MMWLFRLIKFGFRWWLVAHGPGPQGRLIWLAGRFLVDRILKSSQSHSESEWDISDWTARDNGQQAQMRKVVGTPVYTDAISSEKRVVRIGLFLLGILVILSLLVLVPVPWASLLAGIP